MTSSTIEWQISLISLICHPSASTSHPLWTRSAEAAVALGADTARQWGKARGRLPGAKAFHMHPELGVFMGSTGSRRQRTGTSRDSRLPYEYISSCLPAIAILAWLHSSALDLSRRDNSTPLSFTRPATFIHSFRVPARSLSTVSLSPVPFALPLVSSFRFSRPHLYSLPRLARLGSSVLVPQPQPRRTLVA
ncbi:hypothetical protein CC80DRAFT_321051 [Byssothecium circinans]|uniref:Uncharacterized protein n=1 Tax=Byssothecium circinans TaxID=147558 RepID=A0A6A5UDD9_9PLEO|nr:hypothetical protein CC80DRAFT_321051 [Byssothecium circinans]